MIFFSRKLIPRLPDKDNVIEEHCFLKFRYDVLPIVALLTHPTSRENRAEFVPTFAEQDIASPDYLPFLYPKVKKFAFVYMNPKEDTKEATLQLQAIHFTNSTYREKFVTLAYVIVNLSFRYMWLIKF